MADIFLSYNREDLARARQFAEGFERAGLSVWWDQTLHPGEAYDHVTEKALRQARAVIVLWSPRSVESRWVRAEATLAERNRTLVPVMIEPCERPIMFELTQTSDLSGWKGDSGDPAWQSLLASVKRMITHDVLPIAGTAATAPATAVPNAPARSRTGYIAAALVLLLIGGLALGLWLVPRKAPETVSEASAPATVAVPARPRIAVLPFTNLSPDPAQAFFTDGMHEEVLTALTNSGAAMDVISRTTMMTLRQNPKTVTQLRDEFNVDYVVEGSVRRDGDDVRLTLQLINARTDIHMWSQNFDRKLVNAMTLQSEVAGAVASQLAIQVSPAARTLAAPPTQDPVAYDLYLQARLATRLLSGGSSPAAFRQVFDLYDQVISRDPAFGLAYLGRVALGPDPRLEIEAWKQRSSQDLAAARRLLGNDPRIDLFEAINALGGPFLNSDKVLPLFETAEARGLNDTDILNRKGTILMAAGRVDEAIALRRRLISLDPANPSFLLSMAADSFMARQPQESLKAIGMMIRQLPPDYAAIWNSFEQGTRFQYTGDRRLLVVPRDLKAPGDFDPAIVQDIIFTTLRLEGSFAEILLRLEAIKGPLMPIDSLFQSYNFSLPPPPVARVRGWTKLMMGDRPGARTEGREILARRELAPLTPDYRDGLALEWLEKLRRAEGHLFAGEPDKATALAREGMAKMPRSKNAMLWDYATAMGAGILAWSGQEDEAAGLLEQLATEIPGLAPAAITRDPLYALPLKGNARYNALANRLEAQMAATKL